MAKRKKTKSFKFTWSGVLIVVLVVLFVFVLMFVNYIYTDLKNVEQGVFNLIQQINTTNDKIDQFSVSDEQTAQKALKFTEATKQWRIYQNSDFNFQFKSPANWGSFLLENEDDKQVQDYEGFRYFGKFSKAKETESLGLMLATYDFSLVEKVDYANSEVQGALLQNQLGECDGQLFKKLKSLDLGEVRNCFVKENILNQKYILYRYFQDSEGSGQEDSHLVVVYPREEFYVMAFVPNEIMPEVDYFIQSIVFLN